LEAIDWPEGGECPPGITSIKRSLMEIGRKDTISIIRIRIPANEQKVEGKEYAQNSVPVS
jgi:hypothetical protein